MILILNILSEKSKNNNLTKIIYQYFKNFYNAMFKTIFEQFQQNVYSDEYVVVFSTRSEIYF
jgi:hypothetical protein